MPEVGPVVHSQSRVTVGGGEGRLRALERRLEEGYARIDEALQHGDDVERWESFWITLLREYEALCDGYAEAA